MGSNSPGHHTKQWLGVEGTSFIMIGCVTQKERKQVKAESKEGIMKAKT
jgi:hypothetical protein